MIYFIGAGAGDPELLTVKGKRIIDSADVIIYAGSLVNPEVLSEAKKDALIYDSAGMTLEEIIGVMRRAEADGLMTARVHTGDPSIYGAVREQYDALDALGIKYEVIPGVSSFLAAAAALKAEYTLPRVTQTVILTRMEGRTPVPERERLSALARAGATMVIFLSASMTDAVARELMKEYPPETPAAVVYKASWEDELIVRGNLSDIAKKAADAGIKKTALITVGGFLGDDHELSKLYDASFTHEYRQGDTNENGVLLSDGAGRENR